MTKKISATKKRVVTGKLAIDLPMPARIVLRAAAAAVALILMQYQLQLAPAWAEGPQPAPAPADTVAPATPPAAQSPQSSDPFGEDTTLSAKTIAYVKGSGNWDNAFDTITGAFKTVRTYINKEGLKTDGDPMTIFTATDEAGFQFQAAIPIAEAPKNPPHGDIAIGNSPEGRMLKFVHRGSYDALDNTYEAITNFLDERRLEAKDMFIEQYMIEPTAANEDHLVINVYVPLK